MFIVIEGLDGAGKSTQVAKIRQMYESQGRQIQYIHFPRFTAPIYGDLVARFLRGEFGTADQVDPYLVGLIYAGDREQAATQIREWLADGYVVLIDRYVYSNIAYQCAKIEDATQAKALKEWILNLEYAHNKIPRPDLSLFLDVPFAFTAAKLSEERTGDDRDYLDGKSDIHEASLDLQRNVRRVYLDCAATDPTFQVIDCSSAEHTMLPADEIFAKISEFLPKVGN